MRVLFLFLDGVGLGANDPSINPFASGALFPHLMQLGGGQAWLSQAEPAQWARGLFWPVDAQMGTAGKPQSGTGQATIMTGLNVPALLGYHYGPKPNPETAALIYEHSVISRLAEAGHQSAIVNAYPSGFLDALARGKRLRSANQMAFDAAGVPMRTGSHLLARQALSADFTGEMWLAEAANHDAAMLLWRAKPHEPDVLRLTPYQAGQRLVKLAEQQALTFFDLWLTDYIGHRGTLEDGVSLLIKLDGVIHGILDHWQDHEGLFLLTSDHGNLEDISERGHTENRVPFILVGAQAAELAPHITALTDIAPLLLRAFKVGEGH